MTFAIIVKLEMVFNQDYLLTLEEIGYAFAPAFWGFTLAMMIGVFFVDLFGMKKIMNIAFFSHLTGIIVTILARDYITLFWGTTLELTKEKSIDTNFKAYYKLRSWVIPFLINSRLSSLDNSTFDIHVFFVKVAFRLLLGIPMAIIFPHVDFHLIDKVRKKITN